MLGLSRSDAARLGEVLRAASFTVDGVGDLLGTQAHRALLRNQTTPARRATASGFAAATLTRLFALQLPVTHDAVDRALPGLVDPMRHADMLEVSGGEVRAIVDVRPYGDEEHDWWVVCDLTPGLDGTVADLDAEHVLGISEASSSLARLTIRDRVGAALDLGTGCGVQALHLATHADRVTATDVNPRALAMARITADLNKVAYDLREGPLFEPVPDERFGLIVSNPPFVVSPTTRQRLVYRDSGLPGDEIVRRLVTQAPAHLMPGGWCQVLANWVHHRDEPWQDRLSRWVETTGCDAWVLQREVADPATYVETWLADERVRGTAEYLRRYDTWLSWMDEHGIDAVGFGWICLRNSGREHPRRRFEDWPYDIEWPLGPHVRDWATRTEWAADLDDAGLLAVPLRQADGLVQETYGPAGAGDPEAIAVRLTHGVRRARQVDTAEAGLIGACDGDLSLGQIMDAVASLLDRAPAEVRGKYLPVVRELVSDGFLVPPP